MMASGNILSLRITKRGMPGILLLLPVLVMVSLLFFYPLGYAIYMTFTDRDLFSESVNFVGWENYSWTLEDEEFWSSLWNGIVYTFWTTTLSVSIGLAVALLLNQPLPGRFVATGLIIFPYLVPSIVISIAFRWMFNDLNGVINHFLTQLHLISGPRGWFGEPDTAMPAVVLVSVWRFMPFAVIPILARLQGIPTELYEAAGIDGASTWRQFLAITLPMLRNVLLIVVLLRTIWIFNMFDIIWLLTQGGPAGRTQHLPVLAYLKVFRGNYSISEGATISIFMFLFLLVFMLLYLKVQKFEQR